MFNKGPLAPGKRGPAKSQASRKPLLLSLEQEHFLGSLSISVNKRPAVRLAGSGQALCGRLVPHTHHSWLLNKDDLSQDGMGKKSLFIQQG